MKNPKYYLNKRFALAIILVGSCTTTFSQVDSSSNAILTLIKIEASYSSASNLSFNAKFFYTEKDSTGIYITDSIAGAYKISGNNLWSNVDSVVQVQNEQYKVIEYPLDSTLYITKPDFPSTSVFQNNFLDSNFLQADVSSMLISNNGGKEKRLSIFFNSESPYLSYDLYYDSTTNLVNKYEYKIKENADYLKISIQFSNYQTIIIDPAIFSTLKYFHETDTKYIIAPAYTNYEIINPSKELGYEIS